MCNTEISSPINLIRSINEQAKKVYGGTEASFNHADYIRHCSVVFANYFKVFLGNKYLFSTLSAWNRKKADGVLFANPDEKYCYRTGCEELFEPIIEGEKDKHDRSLLKDILTKSSISLSQKLLQKSFGYDLIFSGQKKYKKPIKCPNDKERIKFYALNELTFSGDIINFKNENNKKIEIFIEILLSILDQPESVIDFDKTSQLLWYYRKMQVEYKKETGEDFMVHFIRPSFIDFDHNMLLSLATNKLLKEEELAIVDLILFKIVGLMATERVKEVEALKTKTMFSLTTHSLKTHLSTTVIKTKNAFRDNYLNPYPKLMAAYEKHSREVDTLFHLTELLSLIDKIDNPDEFKKAATDVLFSPTMVSYNLKEHLRRFNERHPTKADIEILPTIEKFNFSITVYNLFFGEKLLELLFNTIFENIIDYGKVVEKKKKLNIGINEVCWKFLNETDDKESNFNEKI